MIRKVSVFFFFLIGFGLVRSAHADWFSMHAAMTCHGDRNIAVIRFDRIWNSDDKSLVIGPALTGELKEKYGGVKSSYSDTCEFSDGRIVELKDDVAQAYAYGMGGGNPDAYFSLLIDGKPVYYRDVWYEGYSKGRTKRAIVILDNQQIISCKTAEKKLGTALRNAEVKAEDCADESRRLVNGPSDAERQKYDRDVRIKNYKTINNDAKICAYFSDPQKVAQSTWRVRDDVFKLVERHSPFGMLSTATLDINNDGAEETIYRVHGYAGYFDGNYFMYFRDKEDDDNFFQCAISGACPPKSSMLDDVEYMTEHMAEFWPSANIISTGILEDGVKDEYRIRYTWIYPVSVDGQYYLYFSPNNKDIFPSAIVGQISSDHKYKTLCTYKKDTL